MISKLDPLSFAGMLLTKIRPTDAELSRQKERERERARQRAFQANKRKKK